jgi:hypothetical protein
MGAVTALRPPGQAFLGNPGLLAAGAAGLVSALLALWAFRGLPLGTGVLWLTAFPIFAAGLAFGAKSAILGGLFATLLVGVAGSGIAALIYLALTGVPAPLLVSAGLRGGRVQPGLPLALLGIWPVAVLVFSALFLAGDGGLEAAMRGAVTVAMQSVGVGASPAMIDQLVRVKAAAIGFWAGLALLVSGLAAAGFLARRNLLAVPKPDWSQVRLPGWYPALPAIAAALFVVMPRGHDAVALSALLLLLVPLFLQGLAGVHQRLRGRPYRVPMLAGCYVLLILFLQVMGPGLVALGLYDQFQRRQAPRNS